jgi:hypothetical protein
MTWIGLVFITNSASEDDRHRRNLGSNSEVKADQIDDPEQSHKAKGILTKNKVPV